MSRKFRDMGGQVYVDAGKVSAAAAGAKAAATPEQTARDAVKASNKTLG